VTKVKPLEAHKTVHLNWTIRECFTIESVPNRNEGPATDAKLHWLTSTPASRTEFMILRHCLGMPYGRSR
jgi:hypothetical protein